MNTDSHRSECIFPIREHLCLSVANALSSSVSLRLTSPSDHTVPKIQNIHSRLYETIDRLSRRAYDGLVFVERSVEHHGHSAQLMKVRNQLVVTRIRFL